MEACYKLAAKFFAMVHLGYIPEYELCGLCVTAIMYIEKHGGSPEELHHIEKQMEACFRHLKLCVDFPVEGNSQRYTRYRDKYRGPYAKKRRELALKLSLWFKELK